MKVPFSTRASLFPFALLLFGLTALPGVAPPARADVSDPFPIENVNRQRSSRVEVAAVGLAEIDVLFRLDRAGAWRSDGTPEGTVRLDLPPAEAVLAFGAEEVYYVGQFGADLALYVTDGTEGGTRRLTSAGNPDTRDRRAFLDEDAGLFYFTLRTPLPDGETHTAIWVTDGTPAGTRELADGLYPSFGAKLDGNLLFSATENGDADLTAHLYRTDGTAAGTERVHPVEVRFFVEDSALGDVVVFGGLEPETGSELWVTDGTEGGTRRLTDLEPGPDPDGYPDAVRSGDLLYVVRATAFTPSATQSLIVTDGTEAGTRVLLVNDSESFYPRDLTPFGDRSVAFLNRRTSTGTEPWVSDGTAAGTRLVSDLDTGNDFIPPDLGDGFTDGFYVFSYTRPPGEEDGDELFASDGTEAGTRALETCPGPCASHAFPFLQDGARIYFSGADETRDRELYFSNAGSAPVRVTDFANPVPGRRPAGITDRGIYFTAVTPDEPVRIFYLPHPDLQTSAGPTPLVSLDAELEDLSSLPTAFVEFEGDLFFLATNGDGLRLFRKSGDAPAQPLDILNRLERGYDGSFNAQFAYNGVALDDRIVTSAETRGDSHGSDGELGGLVELPGFGGLLFPIGDRTFRWNGRHLWVTDGTADGTVRLVGGVNDFPLSRTEPLLVGDRLLFVSDGALWWSDGTIGGTFEAVPLPDLVNPRGLVRVGERVFFTAETSEGAPRLLVTDGTPAGTRLAAPADTGTTFRPLGTAGGRLIYARGPDSGTSLLYSTDGDPAGVVRIFDRPLRTDFLPRTDGRGFPDGVARLGDELWIRVLEQPMIRTDGTRRGTRFTNLLPREGGASPLFAIPGHLLYVDRSRVPDEELGLADRYEMYVTDGTARGTRRLEVLDDFGQQVFPIDDRVYFSAEVRGSDIGMEPWAVEVDPNATAPAPPPADAIPTAPRTLEATGRVGRVELTWSDAADNESRYVIQARDWPQGGFVTLATLPAGSSSYVADGADIPDGPDGIDFTTPTTFRVRAENDLEVSPWAEVVAVAVSATSPCTGAAPATALCLRDDRFAVETHWNAPGFVRTGRGRAIRFGFSDESGAFWFFNEDNVEVVVKVLDGRPVNGNFWSFYGGLSNVEYLVVVSDTEAGSNVTYRNPAEEICGRADVGAFPRLETLAPFSLGVRQGLGDCVPDAETLCLTPDRFEVTVTWRDPRSGDTGVGRAIPGTDDSGYFWFFREENVELVVKVLDGTSVNGFHWVFYGALTDVEYTITVTDTETGFVREYSNPAGNICGDADVRAF